MGGPDFKWNKIRWYWLWFGRRRKLGLNMRLKQLNKKLNQLKKKLNQLKKKLKQIKEEM